MWFNMQASRAGERLNPRACLINAPTGEVESAKGNFAGNPTYQDPEENAILHVCVSQETNRRNRLASPKALLGICA